MGGPQHCHSPPGQGQEGKPAVLVPPTPRPWGSSLTQPEPQDRGDAPRTALPPPHLALTRTHAACLAPLTHNCRPWDPRLPQEHRQPGQKLTDLSLKGYSSILLQSRILTKHMMTSSPRTLAPQRTAHPLPSVGSRTHLDDGRVLGERVRRFRRLTHCDVFDVTAPEDNILVNLLSRRGRPVRGPVLSAEGPHLGVERDDVSGVLQGRVSTLLPLRPQFPTDDTHKNPAGNAPKSSGSQGMTPVPGSRRKLSCQGL